MVDVCPNPQIAGAFYVNLSSVNGPIDGLDKDEKLLLVCLKGKRKLFPSEPVKGIWIYKHSRA